MINCPKCKASIDNDSRFCDQCGQEILFCSHCHRPGKGKRCIFCGGEMVRAGEEHAGFTEVTHHVTIRETTGGVHDSRSKHNGIPTLLLTNATLSLQLTGVDGAVIGRTTGLYRSELSKFNYVSGTHAQLNYMPGQGWCITDKNSSNGTSIGRKRLIPDMPSMLHDGDRLILANIEFIVQIKK